MIVAENGVDVSHRGIVYGAHLETLKDRLIGLKTVPCRDRFQVTEYSPNKLIISVLSMKQYQARHIFSRRAFVRKRDMLTPECRRTLLLQIITEYTSLVVEYTRAKLAHR